MFDHPRRKECFSDREDCCIFVPSIFLATHEVLCMGEQNLFVGIMLGLVLELASLGTDRGGAKSSRDSRVTTYIAAAPLCS